MTRPEQQTGLWVLQSHSGVQLQDAGRFGGAAAGLTQGGAVDLTSARLANALVGNHNQVSGTCPAVLEITLGAAAFRAEQPTLLAVTGAAMPLLLNRQPVARYRSLLLQPGDLLEIGYSRAGARAYLAVAGGFAAPAVCGSVATVRREMVGGLDGHGACVSAGTLLACSGYQGADPAISCCCKAVCSASRRAAIGWACSLAVNPYRPAPASCILKAFVWARCKFRQADYLSSCLTITRPLAVIQNAAR